MNKLNPITRIMLIAIAGLLVGSIFVAIWRIELEAPQYPEGLALLIFANKLGGDVEIINGLNHYIGMQTLHAENFIEFTILPYIIGFFAFFALLVALINHKKVLFVLLTVFILFGILAMVDFYHWNYNYGHNLDPNAAIKVPGMAYQPPLIGYKQLLNFGAYSIPDIGGWMFIGAGVLMLIGVLLEMGYLPKIGNRKSISTTVVMAFFLVSCTNTLPKPIKLNVDACDHCKMTISNEKFASECITQKGKVYKFDDVKCMVNFIQKNSNTKFEQIYISDFLTSSHFLLANNAIIIKADGLKSPMGGNYAAFATQEAAEKYIKELNAIVIPWDNLIK